MVRETALMSIPCDSSASAAETLHIFLTICSSSALQVCKTATIRVAWRRRDAPHLFKKPISRSCIVCNFTSRRVNMSKHNQNAM
jgi:hypothetical protein